MNSTTRDTGGSATPLNTNLSVSIKKDEPDLLSTVCELEKSVTYLDIALHGDRPEEVGNTPTPLSNRFQLSRAKIRTCIQLINQYAEELKSI